MGDSVSVTSKLPLIIKLNDDLTIMPGIADVDAKAWEQWVATKPALVESGDVFETKSDALSPKGKSAQLADQPVAKA